MVPRSTTTLLTLLVLCTATISASDVVRVRLKRDADSISDPLDSIPSDVHHHHHHHPESAYLDISNTPSSPLLDNIASSPSSTNDTKTPIDWAQIEHDFNRVLEDDEVVAKWESMEEKMRSGKYSDS